jgi:hypothetical protein
MLAPMSTVAVNAVALTIPAVATNFRRRIDASRPTAPSAALSAAARAG